MKNPITGTREEETFNRNLDFSRWVRTECAGVKQKFTAFDIDWIFRDYGRMKIQMVETKINQNEFSEGLTEGQRWYLPELAAIMEAGIKAGAPCKGWEWHGSHLLQFEKTMPSNGKIWWDKRLVSEYELIQILEMR